MLDQRDLAGYLEGLRGGRRARIEPEHAADRIEGVGGDDLPSPSAATAARALRRAIAIALVVLLLYSGIIWGVLPQGGGISWQTHLFGFIGGGVAAYVLSQRETSIPITVHEQF